MNNNENMPPAMTKVNKNEKSRAGDSNNECTLKKALTFTNKNNSKKLIPAIKHLNTNDNSEKLIPAMIKVNKNEISNAAEGNNEDAEIIALNHINKKNEHDQSDKLKNYEAGTNIPSANNYSISRASHKLREIVNHNTRVNIPNTSLAATENKELAQDDSDFSCVDVAETIAKNFPIRNHNGELFLFERGVYKPLSKHEAIVKIRSIMHTLKMPKVPPQKYSDIYKLLITSPDINIPKGYIKPNLLACNDFIIDLQTENIFINDGLEFITSKINANFNSQNLNTPLFDKFLNDASEGDPILIKRMLITIGYCLTQDMAGQYFFICYGPPHTGKSLFIKIILALISDDAVCQYSINDLSKEFIGDKIRYSRLCYHTDLPQIKIGGAAISFLKAVTANDGVTINMKFKRMETCNLFCKFIFASNNKLILEKEDAGFNRRLIVIPFLNTISKEAADTNLLPKIKRYELDGIFAKALNAYFVFRDNRYIFEPIDPEYNADNMIVYSSKKLMEININHGIVEFFNNCCVFDQMARVYSIDLYNAYFEFCICSDYIPYKTQQEFTTELQKHTQIKSKKMRISGGKSLMGFEGICLKELNDINMQFNTV